MREKSLYWVTAAAIILAMMLVSCGTPQPAAPTAAAPTASAPTAPAPTSPAPTTEAQPTATELSPTEPPPTAQAPVTLVYGSTTEPDLGLTPVFGGNYATWVVWDLVFNKLVRLNDQLKPSPDLAASWEVSADNLVWTFHLVPNVKWHDGTPFTAEDVKFTYETMMNPDVNSPFASDLEKVASIQVVDDLTLKITLQSTFAPFVTQLADMSIMPKHLLESVTDFQTADFQRNPVGTGPFVFQEWQTGAFLRFTANPDYFRGKPSISEVIFKIVPDPDVLSLQLETGEVQAVEGISPAVATRLEANPDVKVLQHTSARLRFLSINDLSPFFQDKRVRQAMAYAIDRQGIIDTILEGRGELCRTDYPPSSWVYNPNAKLYEYDPEQAKALLAEAGWQAGSDGILVKEGQPFQFTTIVKAGDTQLEQTATVIRDNLKAVGISMDTISLEASVLRQDHMAKHDFDAFLWGRTVFYDPDYTVTWSTWAIDAAYNFVSYSNPALDDLLAKGAATLDPEQRKAIYWQVQDILAEEQPIIFLDWPSALNGVSANFQGYSPDGTTPPTLLWNIEEWKVSP
jgi:peptide/nickel transport system substrate-binding protein